MLSEFIHDPESWIAVAFVIAVVLMAWRGTPILTGMLDSRGARIRGELDEARRLRDEAEQLLAEYQRRQQQALADAQGIINRAQTDSVRLTEQAGRDLDAAIHRRETLAQDRIAQAETKALAEVRAAAVEVAIAATRKLLTESLTQARGAALIDQAIKELPRKLH